MFNKKPQVDSVDTIIGADTTLEGKIHSKTSLRVEGKIHGDVHVDGDVTVGKEGSLDHTVSARNITIAGSIEGTLEASEKLHILSSGHFKGKATMGSIEIEEGATFEGESGMTAPLKEKTKAKPEAVKEQPQ
ncbi:polymer-forming cytoskeletal protein [Halobacillus litoralis]|uniref:bactofilin family protein n=1 Tax=Halobacillus litoralis TaxID=45668 RepID=UPI001CD3B309|nr:polymer-forming cytoskeletal protein [Halobacillus litoralis]MCA0972049.1 polymer-forming cytoskeletal protein [Halobacillus litoralis]